jgi:hypothetical protein
MFQHRIENGEQLAQAGRERHHCEAPRLNERKYVDDIYTVARLGLDPDRRVTR